MHGYSVWLQVVDKSVPGRCLYGVGVGNLVWLNES